MALAATVFTVSFGIRLACFTGSLALMTARIPATHCGSPRLWRIGLWVFVGFGGCGQG
jgi:hypothetical protein